MLAGVVIVFASPAMVTRIGTALSEINRPPVDRAAAVEAEPWPPINSAYARDRNN